MKATQVSPYKQLIIDEAKAKLDKLGARYTCPDGIGIHIIIQFDDTRIDLWPTTGRWKRNYSMNDGTKSLWRLLGNQND